MQVIRILLLLFSCLFYLISSSQSIEWNVRSGGSASDDERYIATTSDGGYVVCGSSMSNPSGKPDISVTKIDNAGHVLWRKYYGGTSWEEAYSIVALSDGYIIDGYTESSEIPGYHGIADNGNGDGWVFKIDLNGNLVWQTALGGTDGDWLGKGQVTSDGNYIVAVSSKSSNGDFTSNRGASDCWIVKLDGTSGAITKKYSMGGSGADISVAVRETKNGYFLLSAYTNSADGDVVGNHNDFSSDYWLVKVNPSDGHIVWQNCLGGFGDEEAVDMELTSDGGVITGLTSTFIDDGDVAGHHSGNGLRDIWVVKVDTADGHKLWQRCLGGTEDENVYSIYPLPDGKYIIAGVTTSTNGDVTGSHGGSDAWLIVLQNDGSLASQLCTGGTGDDYFINVLPSLDGGMIAAGGTTSTNGDFSGTLPNGAFDGFIIKFKDFTLPVTWGDLTAQRNMKDVALTWTILQQSNNVSFIVERAGQQGIFSPIGSVSGAGNSNTTQTYSFTDHSPFKEINNYRIKQVDEDGKTTYSKIVSVKMGNDPSSPIVLFPNPVENDLFILAAPDITDMKAAVYNYAGQLLLHKILGQNRRLSLQQLAKGTYQLKITFGNTIISTTIIKN